LFMITRKKSIPLEGRGVLFGDERVRSKSKDAGKTHSLCPFEVKLF
jgi:hypothetical protein